VTNGNQYELSEVDLIIHQIITDNRGKFPILELQDVVKDISRLNWIKQVLEMNSLDFNSQIISYRDKLLKHIERI
jgi:hypothetical protein